MSKLVCYRADQIPWIWSKVEPHIQKALDRGSRWTADEIYDGLRQSNLQLWTSQTDSCDPEKQIEAALITAIQTRENKYCLLLAIGGDNIDEWVGWLPVVEQWAQNEGCTEMRIYGRIGWAKKINYDVEYTKMSKAL